MIRVSEAVLPGHPDKLCDQLADAVIGACVEVDADAYGQVEVGIWSDQIWLSGGLCTRRPLEVELATLARDVAGRVGYPDCPAATGLVGADPVRAARSARKPYDVIDSVCQEVGDPARWSAAVNDQAVIVGWAGYDRRTRHLPPEHFLAHTLREALAASFRGGALDGHGPDGKLVVRLRESDGDFWLEHLLVTVQQRPEAALLEVCTGVARVARETYQRLQAEDPRWRAPWDEVETLVNPNGPLLNGGSEGDNGQTGRKLVMDHYGPRVPIGGGALSGKHLTHVDRAGACAAREAALHAVATGATECLVRLTYAPNVRVPIDVSYELTGRGERRPARWFDHGALRERYSTRLDYLALGAGTHFFDDALPWNRPR